MCTQTVSPSFQPNASSICGGTATLPSGPTFTLTVRFDCFGGVESARTLHLVSAPAAEASCGGLVFGPALVVDQNVADVLIADAQKVRDLLTFVAGFR